VELEDTWLQRLQFAGWRPISVLLALALVAVSFYLLQRSLQGNVGSDRCRQAYEQARTAVDTAIGDRLMADGPDPKLRDAGVDCGTLRRMAQGH